MHLKNLPPVLLPLKLWGEVGRMSKSMLMDLTWSMATRLSCQKQDGELILRVLRQECDAVVEARTRQLGGR